MTTQYLVDMVLGADPLTLDVALSVFEAASAISPPNPPQTTLWTKQAAVRSIRWLFERLEEDTSPIYVSTAAGHWPMSAQTFSELVSSPILAPETSRPDKLVYSVVFSRIRAVLWERHESKVHRALWEYDAKGRLQDPRSALQLILGRHDEVQQRSGSQNASGPVVVNIDLGNLTQRKAVLDANSEIFEANFATVKTSAPPLPLPNLGHDGGLRVPLWPTDVTHVQSRLDDGGRGAS